MSLLHECMMEVQKPLVDFQCTSFEMDGMEMDVWNFFQTIASYCCSKIERKTCLLWSVVLKGQTVCEMSGSYGLLLPPVTLR